MDNFCLIVDDRGNVEITLYSVLMIEKLSEDYVGNPNSDFASAVDSIMDPTAEDKEKGRAIPKIAERVEEKENTPDFVLGLVEEEDEN